MWSLLILLVGVAIARHEREHRAHAWAVLAVQPAQHTGMQALIHTLLPPTSVGPQAPDIEALRLPQRHESLVALVVDGSGTEALHHLARLALLV